MIKFFRRIRFDLMDKNLPAGKAGKTGKPAWPVGRYFKYAIGEIVLVVIGILIALQINNWNEQRKLHSLKTIYIERLLNDLKQDTLNINILIQKLNNNQHIIKILVDDIDSSKYSETLLTSVENFFSGGWYMYDFTPSMNTYSDLSQSGHMNVFRDSELSNSIKNYYVTIENNEKGHNINKDWIIPLDVELAKETNAFKFDPNTKELFQKNDAMIALKNLLDHKSLLKRNAAGHYWFNKSLKKDLIENKNLASDLINILKQN